MGDAALTFDAIGGQAPPGSPRTIVLGAAGGEDPAAQPRHTGSGGLCGEAALEHGLSRPQIDRYDLAAVNGTGQEAHNLWALEVALDVQWAHSMAPVANILLVTTPTAETLGVQGFPDFMKTEVTVVNSHMASAISQSFGSAEEAFASTRSLLNCVMPLSPPRPTKSPCRPPLAMAGARTSSKRLSRTPGQFRSRPSVGPEPFNNCRRRSHPRCAEAAVSVRDHSDSGLKRGGRPTLRLWIKRLPTVGQGEVVGALMRLPLLLRSPHEFITFPRRNA